MLLRFDSEANVMYVSLRRLEDGETVHHTQQLDDYRLVDYDAAGAVIGVEFLWTDEGLNLDGVPAAEEIRIAVESLPRITPRSTRVSA